VAPLIEFAHRLCTCWESAARRNAYLELGVDSHFLTERHRRWAYVWQTHQGQGPRGVRIRVKARFANV
jgi:hypothetical protein